MSVEEEIIPLRSENEAQRQRVQDLLGAVAELEAALKAAQERVEELEKGKKRPPACQNPFDERLALLRRIPLPSP